MNAITNVSPMNSLISSQFRLVRTVLAAKVKVRWIHLGKQIVVGVTITQQNACGRHAEEAIRLFGRD